MPFRWQDEGLARGSGKVALPSVSAAWLNRPGGLIHNSQLEFSAREACFDRHLKRELEPVTIPNLGTPGPVISRAHSSRGGRALIGRTTGRDCGHA